MSHVNSLTCLPHVHPQMEWASLPLLHRHRAWCSDARFPIWWE